MKKTLVKINELFSTLVVAAESLLAFFFGILFRFFVPSFPSLIIRNVWYARRIDTFISG